MSSVTMSSVNTSIVVAAIDFHQTRVWELDADPSGRPTRIIAEDPKGYFRHLHAKAGNPDGTYRDDNDEYWKALAEHLGHADAILLLGHGNGKANASHHFVAYAEKHYSDVAAKLVAEVRCDIDDLTDAQVLRLAQIYFGTEPDRDFGDNRRGA